MNSPPSPFNRYDIRGIYPTEVNEAMALKLGSSLGTMAANDGYETIVVGRDNKPSSRSIEKAFIAGILSAGITAVELGIGPTDMVSFHAAHEKAYGAMITASHLDLEFTGFKFLYPQGNGLRNDDLRKIKDVYLRNHMKTVDLFSVGQEESIDGTTPYLETMMREAKKLNLTYSGKILADAADGATSNTLPLILEAIGADTIAIHCDENGGFRRHPNPREEHILHLKKQLSKETPLAVASDLDGDRIAVIHRDNETPVYLDGNILFALCANRLLKNGDRVVASIDTSQLLEETMAQQNGTVEYTCVGDPFVIGHMLKTNAKFSGEPNGHYCWAPFTPYNSGTLFAAIIADILKNKPDLSEFNKYTVKQVNLTITSRDDEMNKLKATLRKNEILSEQDGILFETGDCRVLVRPSSTTPKVRITVEGTDPEKVDAILTKYLKAIQQKVRKSNE